MKIRMYLCMRYICMTCEMRCLTKCCCLRSALFKSRCACVYIFVCMHTYIWRYVCIYVWDIYVWHVKWDAWWNAAAWDVHRLNRGVCVCVYKYVCMHMYGMKICMYICMRYICMRNEIYVCKMKWDAWRNAAAWDLHCLNRGVRVYIYLCECIRIYEDTYVSMYEIYMYDMWNEMLDEMLLPEICIV